MVSRIVNKKIISEQLSVAKEKKKAITIKIFKNFMLKGKNCFNGYFFFEPVKFVCYVDIWAKRCVSIVEWDLKRKRRFRFMSWILKERSSWNVFNIQCNMVLRSRVKVGLTCFIVPVKDFAKPETFICILCLKYCSIPENIFGSINFNL